MKNSKNLTFCVSPIGTELCKNFILLLIQSSKLVLRNSYKKKTRDTDFNRKLRSATLQHFVSMGYFMVLELRLILASKFENFVARSQQSESESGPRAAWSPFYPGKQELTLLFPVNYLWVSGAWKPEKSIRVTLWNFLQIFSAWGRNLSCDGRVGKIEVGVIGDILLRRAKFDLWIYVTNHDIDTVSA